LCCDSQLHFYKPKPFFLILPKLRSLLVCMADDRYWDDMFGDIEAGKHDVNALVSWSSKGTWKSKEGTLLHLAADTNNVKAGKRLLQLGADASLRAPSGFTPMHDAIWKGHAEFCTILPAYCLTQTTPNGHTALRWACIRRSYRPPNIPLILWLLDQFETEPDAKSLKWITKSPDVSAEVKQTIQAVFAAAFGRKRRWTVAKAAWLAACCAV
jgi:hypothetical protein